MAENLPTRVPTPDTTPASNSLLYIVDDPYGTPADNATTLTDAITRGHGLGNGIPAIESGTMVSNSIATTKTNLSLNNVDNTSDANKPVSSAQQTAIDAKVSDTAYGGSWDGVTTVAPSKNAVYDKIESMSGGSGLTHPQVLARTLGS